MSNSHFSYFRVKNFKRFKDLEVKDIGQFNLVLGDNNVGKTSLLEALLFDENFDVFINSLGKRLSKRNIGSDLSGGIWQPYVNSEDLVHNDFIETSFEVNDQKDGSFLFDKSAKNLFRYNDTTKFEEFLSGVESRNQWKLNNPRDITTPSDFFEPFVSNLDRHDHELTRLYSRLVQVSPKEIKKEFIEGLRAIDESIEDMEIENVSTNKPLITIESNKFSSRNLLAFYGDGIIAIFRVLLFIHEFRNKRLMIDEIDAGIHYSRMKDYWKVILQSAKENNVQLFATTHNKECIQYFIEAVDELGAEYQDLSRSIRLVEHAQTKEILSFTSFYDKMMSEVLTGNEIR